MIPKNLNLARSNKIVKQFHKLESDRAAAILAACHVEQCLKEFIQLYMLEEAEKAAAETLALPIYPELTETMQEYVVDRIASFYKSR